MRSLTPPSPKERVIGKMVLLRYSQVLSFGEDLGEALFLIFRKN
jgi:hypothetical protein